MRGPPGRPNSRRCSGNWQRSSLGYLPLGKFLTQALISNFKAKADGTKQTPTTKSMGREVSLHKGKPIALEQVGYGNFELEKVAQGPAHLPGVGRLCLPVEIVSPFG